MSKVQIKKKKIYTLKLTKFELLHLRDLMGVLTPPDAKTTVSQHLAEAENRVHIEQFLWNKITELCKEAKLPLGDDAPDYIVAPTNTPTMGVFQISSEPPNSDQEPNNFISQIGEDEE